MQRRNGSPLLREVRAPVLKLLKGVPGWSADFWRNYFFRDLFLKGPAYLPAAVASGRLSSIRVTSGGESTRTGGPQVPEPRLTYSAEPLPVS